MPGKHARETAPPLEALTAADGFFQADPRQPLLVAMDAENDLYLYGLPGDNGMVVVWNDRGAFDAGASAYFDWKYSTPRQYAPTIKAIDLDGDGEKEIAVKNYVASGSGLSIYDLHVVERIPRTFEWSEDGEFIWEDASWDDEYYQVFFEDHRLGSEEIQAQLDKVISFTVDARKNAVTVTDGKTEFTRSLDAIHQSEDDFCLDMTSIIDFILDGSGIRLETLVGHPSWFLGSIGEITARVNYQNGAFTLTDIALKELEPWN